MKKRIYFLAILFLFGSVILASTQPEDSALVPEVEIIQEPVQEEPQAKQGNVIQVPPLKNAGQSKITLDIKGMDIIDVLKMLATRSGMNIVVGKNVTGRVTLFLKDVDIQDAFEIILYSNDLAYERKGDIVNIMSQRDYEILHGERFQDVKQVKIMQLKFAKASDLAKALNQMKSNVGKVIVDESSNTLVIIDSPSKVADMIVFINEADIALQTKIFSLSYAQADKLNAKIQELITKGVGSIKIDERTNKIVVTDYPSKLEDITKVITAFDEKTTQVLIDAQIIQLTPSDQFQMGVDWDYWIRKYFEMRTTLPIALPTDATNNNRLFFGTVSGSNPTKPGQFKAVIDLLRTIGDTKVLSSPRVMVLNNQEAKIHVGVKDAYITSTISQSGTGTAVTSQTVNFVDTGIQLSVTPTINKDSFVTMKIKPEVSDSVRTNITSQGQVTQVPIITTSEAETTIMVKDGVTVIIGGLRKDKKEKTERRIPFLGDIPGLGFAFRSVDNKLSKTDLVILLTPHIVSGENTFSDFSEMPPKEGAVVKMIPGNPVMDKNAGDLTIKKYSLLKPAASASKNYSMELISKINKIARENSPQGKKGEVVLNFTLNSNGQLTEEPQIIQSSEPDLNAYAIKAIKEATPFDSLPKELNKDSETFKISLLYQ